MTQLTWMLESMGLDYVIRIGQYTSSGSNLTYTPNNKAIDGINFTQRLQLGGTGDTTKRALKFVVTGACQVNIYGISGSGTATRTIALSNGSEEIDTCAYPGDAIQRAVISYTGEAATLYIYSNQGQWYKPLRH
jgi:hypothetical protein